MLLVSLGRAGSKALEEHFLAQIEEIQRKRTLIKERITTDHALLPEAQMRYYSAWYYSAIHVATSIAELQTRGTIAAALGLAPALVSECLEFLVENRLVIVKGERFLIGPTRIHLGSDSAMFSRVHANWRLQALQSMERPVSAATSLHYSTVLTISHEDARRVRETLLKAIDETERIFRPSPEEAVYCVGMDWFQISKDSRTTG